MFTGIIEDIGTVFKITDSAISVNTILDDIKIGDSVAVNGACLTATKISGGKIDFDYSPATNKFTNIGMLKKNSTVNLERALRFNSRLGGHILSGHIDTAVKIENIKKAGNFYVFSFEINDKMKNYIIDKGFVAVDGVSLTVSELTAEQFCVTMIPETFNKTIFKTRKNNDTVNIEIDFFAKYAEKILNGTNNKKTDISLEMLKENGFI